MRQTIPLLLALSLWLGATEPSIYFSFDRSPRADFGGVPGTEQDVAGAGGDRGMTWKQVRGTDITPEAMLVNGLSGRALRLGHSQDGKAVQTLQYFPQPGLPATEGSISLWVRPEDWEPKTSKDFHHFFGAAHNEERLILYKYNEHANLVALFGPISGGADSVRADISSWKKGTWHHICLTWDSKLLELYLDGQKVAEKERKRQPPPDYSLMVLGEYWSGNPGCTALDELRIFPTRLTRRDASEEYLRHARKTVEESQAPIVIAVTKGTPVIDGVLGESEWSASVSGMNNSMNTTVSYSANQAECLLSWDDDCLYAAMRSPGKELKASHTSRDGNLWEDDSVELHLAGLEGSSGVYQFIFNSNDALYDARNRDPGWQCEGIQHHSTVRDGKWEWECAIPWKALGWTPAAGKSLRANFVRAYPKGNVCTCLAPGDYFTVHHYAQILLREKTPIFRLAPLGALQEGQMATELLLQSPTEDEAQVIFQVKAPIFPFRYSEQHVLPAGKAVRIPIAAKQLPQDGVLEISVVSEKSGTLYRTQHLYRPLKSLNVTCISTDIPAKELVLSVENRRLRTGNGQLAVTLKDASGKVALRQIQAVSDEHENNDIRFSVATLPPGEYTLEYELANAAGALQAKGTEAYAIYQEKRPWTDCALGQGDIVPPPWTPLQATANDLACWGRSMRIGGDGLLTSLTSQNRELLTGPIALLLDGKPVRFHAQLTTKGQSYAEYRLTPLNTQTPLECVIRAEFDGLLWCTVSLLPSDARIFSLALQIPLNRKYVDGFDDNYWINTKNTLLDIQDGVFHVNPVERPFFWCGDLKTGLMGGSATRRGWHLKDKAHGMAVITKGTTVTLDWIFIDTPVELNARRDLEFYLEATPVKPRSRAFEKITRENSICWGAYVTQFYGHYLPGKFSQRHLDYNLEQQEKHGKHVFYYSTTKGTSPFSAEWHWFGREWHCNPPRLGEYMKDAQPSDQRARNTFAATYGCFQSKDFAEFKLWSLGSFLLDPKQKIQNLYFDLCWPRPCRNPVHGCGWTDAFGYHHQDHDLKPLREVMKRLYILLKQKNPDGLFRGHTIATRLPCDVFYDSILIGELYDRQVVTNCNYYDVLTPDTMRIAYATRCAEMEVQGIPQFERALKLYAPDRYAKLEQFLPQLDPAFCHYLAYMQLHDLGSYNLPQNSRMAEFKEFNRRIGPYAERTFHPYWLRKESPVQPSWQGKCLVSAYSAQGGKAGLVVLNDSDKPETLALVLDTKRLGISANREGDELLSKGKVSMQDGRLNLTLAPRQAYFIIFD